MRRPPNPVENDELDATSSSYGGFAPTQPSTQIFGPQLSKAFEVGTKWELFDRHLLASAAVFQTNVSNARETAPAGLLPGYVMRCKSWRARPIASTASTSNSRVTSPDKVERFGAAWC